MADREYRIDVADADGEITNYLYFDGSDDYDEALDEAATILANEGHVAGDVWVATEGTTCEYVDSIGIVVNLEKPSPGRQVVKRMVEFAYGTASRLLTGDPDRIVARR